MRTDLFAGVCIVKIAYETEVYEQNAEMWQKKKKKEIRRKNISADNRCALG